MASSCGRNFERADKLYNGYTRVHGDSSSLAFYGFSLKFSAIIPYFNLYFSPATEPKFFHFLPPLTGGIYPPNNPPDHVHFQHSKKLPLLDVGQISLTCHFRRGIQNSSR